MKYAKRLNRLEDKSLLNAFQLVEEKDMISFSAGFPSSETYPVDAIRESMERVLRNNGKEALSYCSTSGYAGLRKIMQERMAKKFGLHYDMDEIIITSGSQQGLDMSGMLFVNEGDVVIFELPSYLGAVNALRAYEAELVSVPTDRDGMVISALKEAFDKYGDRVRMIYVNPDFQNPTGRSWSEERRREFMDFMKDYDIPILEDAAYSEISFEEAPPKPLAAFDQRGQVIYVGTFSKIFCPGLRVAWLCAKREIMEKYLVLKNAADLSSSTVAQLQMADYMTHNDIDEHIRMISELYKRRRDAMVAAMEEHFPKEAVYVVPKGGLFIWVELPEDKDATELLLRAGKEKVAFITGAAFYPSARKNNEFRLNFSNMAEEDTRRGIAILGRLIKEYLAE
jgi:DNA-binding transcriptional MocR family regulator